MRYLKEFEGLFASDDKFSVGDIVKLTHDVNGSHGYFPAFELYIISKADSDDTAKIDYIDSNHVGGWSGVWVDFRYLRDATLLEIDEYESKKSAKKYNL